MVKIPKYLAFDSLLALRSELVVESHFVFSKFAKVALVFSGW